MRSLTCPGCHAPFVVEGADNVEPDIVETPGGLVIYHLGTPVHACELEQARRDAQNDARALSSQRTERVARAVSLMARQLDCDWQDAFAWMNARAEEAGQPVESIAVAVLEGRLWGAE